MPTMSKAQWLATGLVATAVSIFYFYTAGKSGDFSWLDSPKHFFNGVFLHDALRALPFADPMDWASRYFARYPALSFGFYPPLLHTELGLAFVLAGVSYAVATGVLAGHAALLTVGSTLVLRRSAPLPVALAGAALLLLTPELLTWGRQIMLELPLLSWMVLAGFFGLRFGDHGQWRDLFLTALFWVLAVYTKQTAVVLVLPLLVLWIRALGWRWLARPAVLLLAFGTVVALVPLVVLQLKFADFNATNIGGTGSGIWPDRWTWQSWLFYPRAWPAGLDWPIGLIAAAGAGGLMCAAAWRRWRPGNDAVFFAAWLVFGYMLMSYIVVKEPRHGLPLFPPIIFLGVAGCCVVLGRAAPWLLSATVLVSAAQALALPAPRIMGYPKAAHEAIALTPEGGRIGVFAHRSANFIVAVRMQAPQKELTVVRLEKLYLDIIMFAELGTHERRPGLTPEQVAKDLVAKGISTVVMQDGFLGNTHATRVLNEALFGPDFALVSTLPVTGTTPHSDKRLRIYRTIAPLPRKPEPIRFTSGVTGGTYGTGAITSSGSR